MDFFDQNEEAPEAIDFPISPEEIEDILRPESPHIYSNYFNLYPEEIPSFEILTAEMPLVKITFSEKSMEKLETKSDSANEIADNLKLIIDKSFKDSDFDQKGTENIEESNVESLLDQISPPDSTMKLKPKLNIDIPPSPIEMLPSAKPGSNLPITARLLERNRNSSITSMATNISNILNSEDNFAIPSFEKGNPTISWEELAIFSAEYKEMLMRLCSEESFLVPDKFWTKIVNMEFPFAQSKDGAYEIWCAQECLKSRILENCTKNGNVYALLNHVVVRLLTFSNKSQQPSRDVLNCLGLFRFFAHVIMQENWECARLCFLPPENDDSPTKEKSELQSLSELLVKIVIRSDMETIFHKALYNETCHLLIVLLSSQMHHEQDTITEILMGEIDHRVYNSLLYNSLHFSNMTSSGILGYFTSGTSIVDYSNRLSCQLFLLLIQNNVFILHELNLDFGMLYNSIKHIQDYELLITLLFLVISHSKDFTGYIMSKADPESFILPVLQCMYSNLRKKCHASKFYVPSILLFLMSQDKVYLGQLQNAKVGTPEWFLDKRMGNTSLLNIIFTSCTYLLVYNASGLKDSYIQTNCLSILYNMAVFIKNLHPYAAQKFVSMLESFFKKFIRSSEEEEKAALKSIILCLIQIINGLISTNIQQNPHIVYVLIQKLNFVEAMSQHEEFEPYFHNISTVLAFNIGCSYA
eukprot:NODE_113_length_18482_cov_1.630746.p1 type:complete len:698 gc:universal NODE_113_length_18482_cov_1.630746:14034-16127(+)